MDRVFTWDIVVEGVCVCYHDRGEIQTFPVTGLNSNFLSCLHLEMSVMEKYRSTEMAERERVETYTLRP